jgi:hypothetical protein
MWPEYETLDRNQSYNIHRRLPLPGFMWLQTL